MESNLLPEIIAGVRALQLNKKEIASIIQRCYSTVGYDYKQSIITPDIMLDRLEERLALEPNDIREIKINSLLAAYNEIKAGASAKPPKPAPNPIKPQPHYSKMEVTPDAALAAINQLKALMGGHQAPLDTDAIIALIKEHTAPEIKKVYVRTTPEGGETPALPAGEHTHPKLDEIYALSQVRDHAGNAPCIYLCGATGTGKTHLAAQLARLLTLPFYSISCSAGMSEAHLLGRVLPRAGGAWDYIESDFVKAYRSGGIFLLDELDCAGADVTVILNSALSNGGFSNPFILNGDRYIARHKDFLCIAAGNTWLGGGNREYSAREKQDGALIDRFQAALVNIDYDPELEQKLINPIVLAWGRDLREKIADAGIHKAMSMRSLINISAQVATGMDFESRKKAFFQTWSDSELQKVGAK